MSAHTTGPLHVGVRPMMIYGPKGGQIANMAVPMIPLEEHKANAHRLVACWNACEGIENPEVVPDMPGILQGFLDIEAELLCATDRDLGLVVSDLADVARAAIEKAGATT